LFMIHVMAQPSTVTSGKVREQISKGIQDT
jgi:hypothetical protein